MGKVTVVGGKVGMNEPAAYIGDPVFANNDWATIIEACQKNKVPDTWVAGDQKSMTINGQECLIDIIGKNHDTYSDGSGTAPLTFQTHYAYSMSYGIQSFNGGGWETCKTRTQCLPAFLKMMPVEIQNSIKVVEKFTSNGDPNYTVIKSDDNLFLLSEIEISGKVVISVAGEGRQYDYYAAGNSTLKTYVVNDVGYVGWLCRSSSTRDEESWCIVHPTVGAIASQSGVGSTISNIAPAFCF